MFLFEGGIVQLRTMFGLQVKIILIIDRVKNKPETAKVGLADVTGNQWDEMGCEFS